MSARRDKHHTHTHTSKQTYKNTLTIQCNASLCTLHTNENNFGGHVIRSNSRTKNARAGARRLSLRLTRVRVAKNAREGETRCASSVPPPRCQSRVRDADRGIQRSALRFLSEASLASILSMSMGSNESTSVAETRSLLIAFDAVGTDSPSISHSRRALGGSPHWRQHSEMFESVCFLHFHDSVRRRDEFILGLLFVNFKLLRQCYRYLIQ